MVPYDFFQVAAVDRMWRHLAC